MLSMNKTVVWIRFEGSVAEHPPPSVLKIIRVAQTFCNYPIRLLCECYSLLYKGGKERKKKRDTLNVLNICSRATHHNAERLASCPAKPGRRARTRPRIKTRRGNGGKRCEPTRRPYNRSWRAIRARPQQYTRVANDDLLRSASRFIIPFRNW